MSFPKNFLWGVSTSATQIEGAYDEDGKCLSIWDCVPKGKVKNNEDAKVACDHYHLYKKDVALLKELGVKVYRFSIAKASAVPTPPRGRPPPCGGAVRATASSRCRGSAGTRSCRPAPPPGRGRSRYCAPPCRRNRPPPPLRRRATARSRRVPAGRFRGRSPAAPC